MIHSVVPFMSSSTAFSLCFINRRWCVYERVLLLSACNASLANAHPAEKHAALSFTRLHAERPRLHSTTRPSLSCSLALNSYPARETSSCNQTRSSCCELLWRLLEDSIVPLSPSDRLMDRLLLRGFHPLFLPPFKPSETTLPIWTKWIELP